MDKIDIHKFRVITLGSEGFTFGQRIPDLTQDDVVEFKIGSKYLYKLSSECEIGNIHYQLCHEFLNLLPVNNAAVAYRQGISYFNLFEPHRLGYYFLRLDISSFFHSIHERLIRKCFSRYFSDEFVDNGKKQRLLDGFIALTTYKVPLISANQRFRNKIVLPIGFKTSPVISNIVFRKLDILIQKYCSSKNIVYSRYADDMLFSSPIAARFVHSDSFFNEISYLLSIDGFRINKKKTIKAMHTISLNGYILSSRDSSTKEASVRISNKKTKIVEKLLYKLGTGESNEAIMTKLFGFRNSPKNFKYNPPAQDYIERYCADQIRNKIAGYRSFLISVLKFNDNYQCVDNDAVAKYKNLIGSLNAHL